MHHCCSAGLLTGAFTLGEESLIESWVFAVEKRSKEGPENFAPNLVNIFSFIVTVVLVFSLVDSFRYMYSS